MGDQQRNNKQEWKVIPFATKYSISNDGVLIRNQNKRVRVPDKDKDGYHKYRLPLDSGISKNFFAHRLVAMLFIPMEDGKDQVNHLNGIKNDNRVENLEWTTSSGNRQHAFDTKIQKPVSGELHGNSILTSDLAVNIARRYSGGESAVTIAKSLKLRLSQVSDVVRGKCWLLETKDYLPDIPIPSRISDDDVRLMIEKFSQGASRKEVHRELGISYHIVNLVYIKRTRLHIVEEYDW